MYTETHIGIMEQKMATTVQGKGVGIGDSGFEFRVSGLRSKVEG